MDYRTFKKHMGEQDESYKYMSDSDMRAKYEEYLNSNQGGDPPPAEGRLKTSGSPSALTSDYSKGNTEVTITDIDMPFGSMVKFMVKWSLASIPAFIILMIIFSLILGIFGGVLAGLLGGLSGGY